MGAPKKPVQLPQSAEEFYVGQLSKMSSPLRADHPQGKFDFRWVDIFGITEAMQLFKGESPYSTQLLRSTPPGQIILAIKFDEFEKTTPLIGVNTRWRNAAVDPEVVLSAWRTGWTVSPLQVLDQMGVVLREIPRGVIEPGQDVFDASEAVEELGREVECVLKLGFNYLDAAVTMNPIPVSLAVLTDEMVDIDEHEGESFLGLRWVPLSELTYDDVSTASKHGQLFDGPTLSLLAAAKLALPSLTEDDLVFPASPEKTFSQIREEYLKPIYNSLLPTRDFD